MTIPRLPKYAVIVRWDTFKLDLIGRRQILRWIALVATALAAVAGFKLLA